MDLDYNMTFKRKYAVTHTPMRRAYEKKKDIILDYIDLVNTYITFTMYSHMNNCNSYPYFTIKGKFYQYFD